MYRRPKSLEVLLAIRNTMSEEAGHDVSAFVEMVRSGVRPGDRPRTVTRVEGELCEEPQQTPVAEPSEINVSDD